MIRCLVFASVLLVGCKNKESVVADVNDADTEECTVDCDDPPGTTVPDVPFGMESRPPNPGCVAPERPPAVAGIRLQNAYPGQWFDEPLAAEQPPGQPNRWLIAEREGFLRSFDLTTGQVSTALNLTSQIDITGEGGLLGFAIHPDFATQNNPEIFVHYTTFASASRVVKFTSNDGGVTFDPASGQVLIALPQPTEFHNGGDLAFGPDGFLYASFGDGEGWWIQPHPSQNTDTLLGGMARIDTNGNPAPGNPFMGGDAPELFAIGLRNPWRFSIDQVTGDVWVGDVGDSAREEVDVVEMGGNYGWPEMEGFNCVYGFNCNNGTFELPIFDYSHAFGVSVIGGYVYRGGAIPGLYGSYVFSDWIGGNIWVSFPPGVGMGWTTNLAITGAPMGAAWAQDLDGELYLLTGEFMQLVPDGGGPANDFPMVLSDTGCVSEADATQMVDAAIPYDVNVPLWSDGSEKNRWFAIPDDTQIEIGPDGDWDFPVDSVLIKEFHIEGVRVETRLLVRHEDGGWAGYAYQWNVTGDDAFWVPSGAVVDLPSGATWTIPSQAQCMQCHTEGAGGTIGPETAQMNRSFVYPLGSSNQIDTFAHVGLFTGDPGESSTLDAHPELLSGEPVESRARAYLHANCAHCHRPDGSTPTDIDFRWTTPISETETCQEPAQLGDLGVPNAMLIAPGEPARSTVSLRMLATDEERMPAVGSVVVDSDAAGVVEQWISEMQDCLP